jgi:hypothetical protein
MDRLSAEDQTGQRIGLFFVGFAVAILFALFGWITLPVTDFDPSPHNEVKWSAVPDHYVDHPLLVFPWLVVGLGVGVMVWTIFGRWARAEETARGELAREPAQGSSGVPPATPY